MASLGVKLILGMFKNRQAYNFLSDILTAAS